MSSEPQSISHPGIEFIDTKEYKRFIEFTEACKQYRYIGICYGEPGVGKSFAAEHYLKWDDRIVVGKFVEPLSLTIMEKVQNCHGVLVVAPVTNSPKIIKDKVKSGIEGFGIACDRMRGETNIVTLIYDAPKLCPLVVIDEADRLDINSLEQLRDMYDEYKFGLVLIGMPGIERRLSRYPQLYSRIGFRHEFNRLSQDEMKFIIGKLWKNLGLECSEDNFTDVEALNTFIRITNGNFRLIDRMFSQIGRILKINNLNLISKEVVDAARECLVIG